MKTNAKRFLALFLALTMVCSLLPMTALAAEGDKVTLTVYRNPVEDPAGTTFSTSNLGDFSTRDTTAAYWEEAILVAARAAGYTVPDGSYAEYYVSSNNPLTQQPFGWVGIADGINILFTKVNYANYFGWNSVNVGSDTESRVRILDSNGTEIVGDTIGDLVVTVKSYVEVEFKDELGNTLVATQKVDLNNTLASLISAAETAAKAKATELSVNGYHYEFAGWDVAPITATIDVDNAADVDGKTYVAKYNKSYDITWQNENGVEIETTVVAHGDTPSYTVPAKEGHTGAWSPEVKAATEPATYTATYAPYTYTVTWKNNGGTVLETDENVPYGTTPIYDGVTPVAENQEEGKTYTWTGWSPAIDTVKGDVTYTATYTNATTTYTVKFDTDGGTAVADATVGHGEKITANTTTTKDGYRFDGWELEDGTDIDLSTYTVESDVKLVAKWVEQVTVKFVVDGAEHAKYVIDINTALTSAPANPTKSGYEFETWVAEDNDSGIDWFDTENIATVKYGEDITYTAQWLKIHTVTFNPNGATSGTMAPQTFLERQTPAPTLNKCEYEKDGYDFLGWATSADGEVVYADEAELPDADLTLYAVWKETPKADTVIVPTNNEVTVTYGTDYDLLALIAPVVKDENGNVVEGAVVTVSLDDSNAGTRTATLSYAGGEKYNEAADVTVTVIINPAAAEIAVASQLVKYGETVADPFQSNCDTIDFIAGIDAHDETYVVGSAMVTMPTELLTVLALGASTLDINDLSDMTIDEAKKLVAAAENMEGVVGDAAAKLAQYKEQLNKLIAAMEKIQAELPIDTELKIGVVETLALPEHVGIYVAGSILADDNYAAASEKESVDVGYLVIVPDGVQAQLAWNENDDNYIVTLEKLENADLGATATVVGTPDNGNTISGQPGDHLEYLFVGVDNDGELILNRVRTTEDVNEVLTEVGVYAQVAYIANWDNVMYYAMPIARPVIVSPNVADVKILDANGNENYAQVYTYTGEPIDVTVTVDGLENVEGLSFKFIGSDTTVDGWYRSEAPTDAGVYTIIAVYTETDADGDLCKAGGAVGIIIIEPADAEVGLEYTEVCPNGEEHFATITNEALDYITIAIDRDANTAYVNLPADVKAHAERIVGYLPAEIEAKVMALLEKYSEFDGDVSSATVKAELESIMAELIEYNMTEKAYELAKETVAKLKDEIANNEDIQALASRIKEEVATIESKITEKLSKEYAEQIVNYLKEIYESGDVDVDALKTKLENKIKAMVEENPELEAIAGVLYLMSEDIVAAIKNSDEVDQVIAEIENIIAKVKSLGLDDAEAIATKLVGYMAEQVDTEQLKALLEEAVAKVENLGYIEYAKQLLSDMSAMYPIDVDVDAYVNAVKTELEALVNTVKAKIKSGELKETDLDDIEAYVDSILGQLNTLIDKIPEGYTVVFGSNPSEEGTYDCYAMNISANYKPEFVSATLVIGHVAVIDAAVASTCTETGLTEGSHCAKCGVTLVAQETVPATDHDWELTGTVPSSCTEKGVQKYTCKNDPTHTKEVAIEDLAAHTPETDAAVPATCITTGLTEGSHCSVCDAVIVAQETVPATGHDWGAWVVTTQPTYTSEGVMTRVCANDESHVETRTIAKLVYVAPVIPQPTVNVRGLNTVDHVSYIIGYTDGTVKPTGTITRAEMATIFFRLMTEDFRNEYWSTSNRFADVDEGKWYNLAISTLDAAGVITDSDDGLFRPNEPITRAELAVMAAQFCTVTGNIPYASFTDVPMNHWAAKEIALVEYAGWIEGYKGKFRPEDNLTRGEAVTIVNRMLNRGAEAEHMLEGMVTFTDNVYGAWYYEAIQEAANSHTYIRSGKLLEGEKFVGEKWTYLLENPDWAAIEKGWVAAHAE